MTETSVRLFQFPGNSGGITTAVGPVIATGGTTARTLENRFSDAINVVDYDATTAVLRPALQDAIAYASSIGGGRVRIPKGEWTLSLGEAEAITLSENVSLIGDGIGATVLTISITHASQHQVFSLMGGNAFGGMSIVLTAVGAADYSVFWPRGDGLHLHDLDIDLGADGSNWRPNIVFGDGSADSSNVVVERLHARNYNWRFLKSNATTNTHYDWVWRDCVFRNFYRTGTINTPNGPCRMLHDNCRWEDCFDPSSSHHAGAAGAESIEYLNCKFEGAGSHALRFEECDRYAVIGCYMLMDQGDGIECLHNSIGGVDQMNLRGHITRNTIINLGAKSPGGNDQTGIESVWDGDASIGFTLIADNFIQNYGRGIRAGEGQDAVLIKGNFINDCTYAIYALVPHQNISDNFITSSTTGLYGSGRGGAFGPHAFRDVTTLADAANGAVMLNAFSVIGNETFSLAAGVTELDLFAMPAELIGRITVNVNGSAAAWRISAWNIAWDGTTLTGGLTAERIQTGGSGLLDFSVDGLEVVGGRLILNVNNSSGSAFVGTAVNVDFAGTAWVT